MPCKIRVKWPFSGLFFDFRVVLTSEGYLLKITFKKRFLKKPARRKQPGKMGKKTENSPRREMPKNGRRGGKMAKIPFLCPLFHFGGHFLAISGLGHFPFLSHFPGLFASGRFSILFSFCHPFSFYHSNRNSRDGRPKSPILCVMHLRMQVFNLLTSDFGRNPDCNAES